MGIIESKLDSVPSSPGVYAFFDEKGDVVYIGKAKDLKKRVRSYFSGRDDGRFFFDRIVSETRNLECIVTNNEKEAFILESNLIRENKPRYNVVFRDDKRYLSLRITVDEEFPGLYQVRGPRDDGARYIGPFDSAAALRETLHIVQKVFPVRTCRNSGFSGRRRPCLKHQLGRCSAPCTGEISPEDYRGLVDDTILFLTGRKDALTGRLRERMAEASAALDFERAAAIRDQIKAVERTVETQHVAGYDVRETDVFGFAREGDAAAVQVLVMRRAGIVSAGSACFRTAMPDGELLSSYLGQYYCRSGAAVPEEVLLPFGLEDAAVIAELLSERRGGAVRVHEPKRGEKRARTALASKNAWHALKQWAGRAGRGAPAAEELKAGLGLRAAPARVECFDISNLGGSDAVGGMSCFVDGEPWKAGYMRFRIRGAATRDDPSMIAEVVSRRFKRRTEKPDLLVIDGGPAQLSAALAAMAGAGAEGVEAVSIAKERPAAGGNPLPDRIYLPRGGPPLILDERSPGLHLLQRARDEAHRFAGVYHRKLRKARTLATGLEGAPGIGPGRRKSLLALFGGIEGVRNAGLADLASAPLMNDRAARSLWEFLHGPEGGGDGR